MIDVIDKLDFREFSKIFFTDPVKYKRLSNKEKERHFYMICQTCSKKDPVMVNKYQATPHWSVVDLLHSKFSNKKYTPKWVYASDKKTKLSKAPHTKYADEVLQYAMQKTGYEYKSIISLSKTLPEQAKELFDECKKDLKGVISKRKV